MVSYVKGEHFLFLLLVYWSVHSFICLFGQVGCVQIIYNGFRINYVDIYSKGGRSGILRENMIIFTF